MGRVPVMDWGNQIRELSLRYRGRPDSHRPPRRHYRVTEMWRPQQCYRERYDSHCEARIGGAARSRCAAWCGFGLSGSLERHRAKAANLLEILSGSCETHRSHRRANQETVPVAGQIGRRDWVFKSQPLLYFELRLAQEICIGAGKAMPVNSHKKHKKTQKQKDWTPRCYITTTSVFVP